jgi:hypothetical protein
MNSQSEEGDRAFAGKAKKMFDASVRSLDGETRSRLAQARARAVDAAERNSRRWFVPAAGLLPAGGLAAAILAVALIVQMPGRQPEAVEAAVISDLDLLLEGEDLGLLEDLDFYAWLLEQPELLGIDAADGSSG